MAALELRVPPVLVWIVCAAAMWVWDLAVPDPRLRVPGHLVVAGVLVVVAAWLGIAGIAEFRRHRTTVHPMRPDHTAQVVSSGVYRLTRNPMYLAMAILLVAVVVARANPISGFGVVAFVAYLTRFQVLPEERMLAVKFGSAYTSYRSRVRRWL